MIRVSRKAFNLSIKRLNGASVGYLRGKIINRCEGQLCNLSIIRFNSSFVSDDSSSSFAQELVQTSLAAEPTLSSLGLGGLSPKGFIQSGLELLHADLGIPWWSSIVLGTICLRLAITPLVIIAQRNAANMHNNMPTLQRMQMRMREARMEGDPEAVKEISIQMIKFMREEKVNPFKNLLTVGAQIPIFLSVFTGLREMSNLPVESMKMGGMLWFTDLTIPDPLFLLPLMTAGTLLATIEVGVDGLKVDNLHSSAIKFMMRTMPFISLPIMINFPSAMLCYWFTSNTFSLLQVLILRIPKVRKFFSIPEMVNHANAYPIKEAEVPKISFSEAFRMSLKNIELAKEMEERKRVGMLKMKESAQKQDPSDVNGEHNKEK